MISASDRTERKPKSHLIEQTSVAKNPERNLQWVKAKQLCEQPCINQKEKKKGFRTRLNHCFCFQPHIQVAILT